ncbi:MAG: Rad52/Rad22 family DNA repair protein [Fimbriiglobus sp.]
MDGNLSARLSAPFAIGEVKFKPQSVKGNRAMALAYIDSRAIQDRLDEVVGVENWQDDYELLPDGSVVCRLQIRVEDRWITKTDVGSPSEQPDGGDRLKAAFSDALKRAAVKYGIGRYLYRLPILWADYDPVKRQFVQPPQLPAPALPKKAEPREKPTTLPGTGQELHRRLRDYDAKLAAQKQSAPGALLAHVAQAGVKAGYGDDITKWSGPAIPFAVDLVKHFEPK